MQWITPQKFTWILYTWGQVLVITLRTFLLQSAPSFRAPRAVSTSLGYFRNRIIKQNKGSTWGTLWILVPWACVVALVGILQFSMSSRAPAVKMINLESLWMLGTFARALMRIMGNIMIFGITSQTMWSLSYSKVSVFSISNVVMSTCFSDICSITWIIKSICILWFRN